MTVKQKSSIPLLQPEAPLPVKISVVLFALVWLRQMHYLLPAFLYDFHHVHHVSRAKQQADATLAFWLALDATSILAMVFRKNWARITQVLSTLAGLLLIAWSLTIGMDFRPGIVYFSGVVATVLLFLPSAVAWFKKRQQ
jgi:hypothetical protein